MTYLVFGLYSLFAVTTVSASFGSAVAVASSYLLFMVSCVVCVIHRKDLYLLGVDWLAFLLVGWLIIASLVRSNAWPGVEFVLKEYRLLWMAPFLGFAVAAILSRSQIWVPLIVGSAANMVGSTLLVLGNGMKIAWVNDLVDWAGVQPNGKGAKYVLNGKFVQSFLMAIWSGLSFARAGDRLSVPSIVISTVVLVFIGWAFYIGLFFQEARTGAVTSFVVFTCMAVLFVATRESRKLRLVGMLVAILIIGTVGAQSFHSSKRIKLAIHNIERYVEGRKHSEISSVGQRLDVWRQLSTLTPDEWLIGRGSGNWDQTLDMWFPEGHVQHRFAVWNDYHSQFIWLLVQGGVVALILYVALCGIILSKSLALILSERAFALGGLGFGITGILILAGAANSVFTALREAHVIGLMLLIWSALYRKHICATRKRREPNASSV